MPASVLFDHYEVLQRADGSLHELGRGAMGITYKAYDTNLRIPVALKVINGTFLNSTVARQRFVREARAAAKLRHRHVASVFHLAVEGENMFYAMEFIDGETVDALIKRQGPLTPILALQIVDQVARALNAAQVHGLVHRDIKPANLMLIREDDELTVKVIDFGLAKTLGPGEEDAATVSQGGFVGTPHFASPEQLEEGEIDVRSDIYSLGVTLWYMLAGQTPFAGSMAQVMSQHLAKAPPFERLTGVPAPISGLLRRMLEKDRTARPQTPSELRQEIERTLAEVRGGGTSAALAAEVDAQDFATMLEDTAAPSMETTFAIGTVVAGRYRVTANLGDTNTGMVFRAEHTETGAPVRLLVLHRELTAEASTYTQIEREVERVAPLEHPNLLRVFGLETIDTTSFIALEWTEGFSLLELLRARRELEAVEVLKLLEQAAEGVDYAVANGLKRLDLALHQVLLHFPAPIDKHALLHHPVTGWPAFQLKLNPLGMTRELSASETWSGEQTMVDRPGGSTAATSEQARIIQALGAVVYELLGGTLSPLGSSTSLGVRYTPLANLSERGNEALRHALAPAPPYAKAGEFHRALAEVSAIPLESSLPVPTGSQGGRMHAPPPPRGMLVPPLPSGPPTLPPRETTKPVGAPLAIAAMLVALMLFGGGVFFFVLPLFNKKPDAGEVVAPTDTAKTSEAEEVTTPPPSTPAPVTPPAPPPPTRRELLATAIGEARKLDENTDLATRLAEWVKIARDFPESEAGKVELSLIIEQMRQRGRKANAAIFPNIRSIVAEAAQLGVVPALMYLGDNFWDVDPATSFKWYTEAADRGQPAGMTMAALMLLNGYGCEKDLAKAIEYLRAASAKDYPPAKTALAECYQRGINVPKDDETALTLLREAVEKENSRAMDMLATAYSQGKGVKVDNKTAYTLYRQAADLGYSQSLGNLAVLHFNGLGGAQKNVGKAMELIREGVELKDDFCLFLYARCLETGTGLPAADVRLAEKYYVEAAEAGNPDAAAWCKGKEVKFVPPRGPRGGPP